MTIRRALELRVSKCDGDILVAARSACAKHPTSGGMNLRESGSFEVAVTYCPSKVVKRVGAQSLALILPEVMEVLLAGSSPSGRLLVPGADTFLLSTVIGAAAPREIATGPPACPVQVRHGQSFTSGVRPGNSRRSR